MRKLPEPAISSGSASAQVGNAVPHESARAHVTGTAQYVDDHPPLAGELHAAVGRSTIASGQIVSINLDAVRQAEGVIAVITAADVPGHIDIGPVFPGDPVLADGEVSFHGQALFAVAARTHELARRAVGLAEIAYHATEPVLDIDQAMAQNSFVRPVHVHERGDAGAVINAATSVLEGALNIGGQEHFYLEGQVSIAVPGEAGDMFVLTSSQHPTEVQKLVADVLGLAMHQVNVEVRRMGGAFGGKETQAAPWACIAALLANKTGKSVRLRLPRSDDMILTGKRHPFSNRWRVAVDDEGQLLAAEIVLQANCGYSPDLSDAIVDRAMFHSDNAYYIPDVHIEGHRCRTNLVSNTAFRGFGGPQGMLTIEAIMDDIARLVGCDPLEIRKRNLYGNNERNVTPYHQVVEQNHLAEIISQLEVSANYQVRREKITRYNKASKHLKRGIALTPVKFGISFTVTHLNQAGALMHIYSDGSIHLNHGGTEMGQGLFTKVAQVVATEFSVDAGLVRVSATRTDKVPNTSPTAASAGTDLNGKAAQQAARKLKRRLQEFAATHYDVAESDILFHNNEIRIGENVLAFQELVALAYMNRVSLSATGFYKTPRIHYDRETASGRPFFYYAQGAAVTEVVIDTLTGEYKVLRTDILHDVGSSLNPAIDIGQIEGGFVQGLGWLTTEELCWDDSGRLLTTGPATYKIPAVSDVPGVLNVALYEGGSNEEDTIYHSKAVGEPPLMLAISAWSALRDAVSSISSYRTNPRLDLPATPERVLFAAAAMEKFNAEN